MGICVVEKQIMKGENILAEDKNESGVRFCYRFLIVMFIISSLMPGAACFAEDACSHVNLEWLSRHAAIAPNAKIVLKREQESLCETVLLIDKNLIPIYAGKSFILLGKFIKDRQIITQDTLDMLQDAEKERQRKAKEIETLEVNKRKVFFENRFKTLDTLTSFSFNAAKNHKPLYVITDPGCFHCKRLLPKLETAAIVAGVELKVIVYPVLGAKSRDMAAQAICNGYSLQEYKNIEHSNKEVSCEKATALLKKTVNFLALADISFVPLVVAGDGSWVVEGSNIAMIRKHLGIEHNEGDDSPSESCKPDEADL